MSKPSVAFVVLNFNGYKDTIECVESLLKISYENYSILIVDNNSTDGSEKEIRDKFNDITIIQTGRNFGYAQGNNIGIKYALSNNFEYVCILNNDVVVKENLLDELVNYSQSINNNAIIGPMILDYHNESTVQSTGATIDLLRGVTTSVNSGVDPATLEGKIIHCDSIVGACMLIHRSVFDQIGLLPNNYFLFFEETEWCLQARRKGVSIHCNCKTSIQHKTSSSVKKVIGLSEYFMYRNRIVFEKRNASLPQLLFFFVYLVVETVYLVIRGRKKIEIVRCYLDGFLNRVSSKYSFVYLGENETSA